MFRLVRVVAQEAPNLNGFDDRTVFQTDAWIRFVASTQNAEPVIAAVVDSSGTSVGRFTGLIVRKAGVRILGSPLPGWTTSYMGFNLDPAVPRGEVLTALARFAFRELKCLHVEIMDRRLRSNEFLSAGYSFREAKGFEIDLSPDESTLFSSMKSSCRRCIRKADKSGVKLEIATDMQFAEEYHDHLTDVFAKQSLAPTYTLDRVQAMLKMIMPTGNLLLVRARDAEANCIATGIFPAFNGTMYFWGGASWRASQHLRPNEAIQWYAMRHWRNLGIEKYDMCGGGEYKRKYGGSEISIPWGRQSRFPGLESLRGMAKTAFRIRQRLRRSS